MADIKDGIGLLDTPLSGEGIPIIGSSNHALNRVMLDFPKIATARTAVSAAPLAVNDVLKVLKIPANYVVVNVAVRRDIAAGAAGTIDIGWDGDPDGWADGLNINTTGSYIYQGAPRVFDADNAVQVTFKSLPLNAKIEVFAMMSRFTRED